MSLLLAAILLSQGNTAEETLKKIEDLLTSAKSVSLQAKIEYTLVSPPEPDGINRGKIPMERTVSLQMKEGNKVAILIRQVRPRDEEITKFVSDGSKIWLRQEGKPVSPFDCPADLNARIVALICRLGLGERLDADLWLASRHLDFTQHFESAKQTESAGEDGARKVSFTVNDHAPNPNVRDIVHLVNPKSLTFLSTTSLAQDKIRFREFPPRTTFSKWILDAGISDDTFKLPEEKK